jgi:uncharacterized protein YegJ (DUF2314 family)
MRLPSNLLHVALLALLAYPAQADDDATPPATPQPVPTGSLLSHRAGCEFAIYLLPGVTGAKPEDALAKVLAKDKLWTQVTTWPQKPDKALLLTHVITDLSQYRPPDIRALQYFGRGLSADQAQAVQKSLEVFILEFDYPTSDVWKDLRSATVIAGELGAATQGLIWDADTRELFTPDEWNQRRLGHWPSDGVPQLSYQYVYHAYKDGDYERAVSLGMSKFGLPDIAINGFVWSDAKQVGDLLIILCQRLAEGAELRTPGQFDLDIRDIKQDDARKDQMAGVLDGGTGKAKLGLVLSKPEEGDDDNRQIEVTFDRYDGTDLHAKQDTLFTELFGAAPDKTKSIRHNDEVLAESAREREKLPGLRALFQKGLAPGEFIQLKAPFVGTENRREWMWVEVVKWDGDAVHGMLKNEPYFNPQLHAGQMVDISANDVFDYIHTFPDGHTEGNTTGPIIEKMEEAQ